jgi:integrase/recombinase XerD
MKKFAELAFPSPDPASPFTDRLRLAVAAYLARFKGSSREHTESDLRCYLAWCAEHGLDPLDAQRPHLELYIRWMQEICQFKPSTISRRFPVTTGFYRTCAIDGVLQHSPAEHVRRPTVPAESPTLGFTHLRRRPGRPLPRPRRRHRLPRVLYVATRSTRLREGCSKPKA